VARQSDPKSNRQRRHLSFVAEFTADIRHISGQDNVVADTLSRPPPTAVPGNQSGPLARLAARPVAAGLHIQEESQTPEGWPAREPEGLSLTATVSPPAPSLVTTPPPLAPVDLEELAASQASCGDCNRARSLTALRVLAVKLERGTLLVDASLGVLRPLVPAAHREAIFNAIHRLAHPGIRALRRLIASRFV
jgi:hypothetical protein